MRLSVKYSSLSMKYRVLHSYKLFDLRKIFKLFEWDERFIQIAPESAERTLFYKICSRILLAKILELNLESHNFPSCWV